MCTQTPFISSHHHYHHHLLKNRDIKFYHIYILLHAHLVPLALHFVLIQKTNTDRQEERTIFFRHSPFNKASKGGVKISSSTLDQSIKSLHFVKSKKISSYQHQHQSLIRPPWHICSFILSFFLKTTHNSITFVVYGYCCIF